ncbi:hypothetical protein DsansV1_C03g0028351 [Dioscorea sansibarensis]
MTALQAPNNDSASVNVARQLLFSKKFNKISHNINKDYSLNTQINCSSTYLDSLSSCINKLRGTLPRMGHFEKFIRKRVSA